MSFTTAGTSFQSTPPVKAATSPNNYVFIDIIISIHAAREGGDGYIEFIRRKGEISIHAAREGGDPELALLFHVPNISIHAAREGGDGNFCSTITLSCHFNPRRP